EAVAKGVHPFCITVDTMANQYLPQIFGRGHYLVLDHINSLPNKLPEIYFRLRRCRARGMRSRGGSCTRHPTLVPRSGCDLTHSAARGFLATIGGSAAPGRGDERARAVDVFCRCFLVAAVVLRERFPR